MPRMGIAAVTTFVAGGVTFGTIAALVALRKGERAGTVALFSATAICIASFMLIHWLFWSSLDQQNWREVLMPDFFSPGRKEKILTWYSLGAAGLVGLVVAACSSLREHDQRT